VHGIFNGLQLCYLFLVAGQFYIHPVRTVTYFVGERQSEVIVGALVLIGDNFAEVVPFDLPLF
jgi:hypothetical protein